jgi:hypothetical protein
VTRFRDVSARDVRGTGEKEMSIGFLLHKTGIRIANDLHFNTDEYIIGDVPSMNVKRDLKIFKYKPTLKERLKGEITIYIEISDVLK